MHLSMLVPGAVLGAFGEQPQVLATLFDPARVVRLDAFALASMFGLTPAEAKVATRIVDVVRVLRQGEVLWSQAGADRPVS